MPFILFLSHLPSVIAEIQVTLSADKTSLLNNGKIGERFHKQMFKEYQIGSLETKKLSIPGSLKTFD